MLYSSVCGLQHLLISRKDHLQLCQIPTHTKQISKLDPTPLSLRPSSNLANPSMRLIHTYLRLVNVSSTCTIEASANHSRPVTPGITAVEYAERRSKLAAKLPKNAIAVIAAADVKYRSGAVFYEFHQDSNFFYLTGRDKSTKYKTLR